MSDSSLKKNKGYVLIKLGNKSLIDSLKEAEEKKDFSEIVERSISLTPHYREADLTSIGEQEAFVKYLNILKQFIQELDKSIKSKEIHLPKESIRRN